MIWKRLVGLKCDYAIPKIHLWNKVHEHNHQMLYWINNHLHEERFIIKMNIHNNIESIFHSDCDIINHHLH